MANAYLKGVLGFKGERGYSAYDLAVKNGFVGTEKDWLATLGTSSHFDRTITNLTTSSPTTTLDLPGNYTSNSYIDVYKNGTRIDSNAYTINTSTRKITLTQAIESGAKVEVVCLTMSTNELPITETISKTSNNESAPGAKAVYDYVESKLATEVPETIINDNTTSTDKTYSSVKIVDMISYVNMDIDKKLNKDSIAVVTGSKASIAAGATEIVDVEYPTGFNKSNTIVISKMTSNNNVYYESLDLTSTANGYPIIKNFALTDTGIRLWLLNTNSTTAKIGHYKITLLKVGD